MKRFFSLILLALAIPALSAEKQTAVQIQQAGASAAAVTHRQNRATELIGMDVKNAHSEKLGDLKEIVIDLQGGRIIYAVLATGGFLGFGDKLIALPPSSLSLAGDNKHLLLEAEKETLKDAAGFNKNNWPEVADAAWERTVYRGETSVRFAARGERPVVEDPAGTDRRANAERNDGRPHGYSNTNGAVAGLHRPAKVSEIIGMTVRAASGDKLGEIKDLMVNLPDGRILYAVLSSGGFLGVGDRLLAIPASAFTVSDDGKVLMLNRDKESLRAAPGFDKNRWPETADPAFITEVYRYHGQRLDWAGGGPVSEAAGAERKSSEKADNTARNERDRGGALVPTDQSESRPDREMTQKIRKAIVGDRTFSTMAKNIKIITVNGHVTLRGPVRTEEERRAVLEKAHQIAGAAEVVDQLEVKKSNEPGKAQ